MEYSKEQIEDVFDSFIGLEAGFTPRSKRVFMQDLENPKPVFKVGEVVMSVNNNPIQWDPDYAVGYRHLNLTENPSTALALERLEQMISPETLMPTNSHYTEKDDREVRAEFVQQAIDDIKKMVG